MSPLSKRTQLTARADSGTVAKPASRKADSRVVLPTPGPPVRTTLAMAAEFPLRRSVRRRWCRGQGAWRKCCWLDWTWMRLWLHWT